MRVGFELFAALDGARPLPAARPRARYEGPVGDGALRYGRLCETYPDAIFCALLGHRPVAQAHAVGAAAADRRAQARGVVDEDGGLWHRTLDELDACAAAYAAYALAAGHGHAGSATRTRA